MANPMNGAESLIKTLAASGVDVCFTNPGTSEMHFVAALDKVPEMRAVLCLFEGVASGAADGYGRMADKPASTLFHLGPGLGNAVANLHNARRAETPIVNIVGEHATYHRHLDAPLTSDIEALAGQFSKWMRVSESAKTVAKDTAEAVAASMEATYGTSTLILPADTAWLDADGVAAPIAPSAPAKVDPDRIRDVAKALERGGRKAMLMSGRALRAEGLEAAARIAAKTGVELYCDTFNGRQERGAGRVTINKLPYFGEQVAEVLEGVEELIIVGTKPPVSFFAYPGKPSELTPEGVTPRELASPSQDVIHALQALADEVNAPAIESIEEDPRGSLTLPELPEGPNTLESVGKTVAALMPEGAVVANEAATSGLFIGLFTENAHKHDWLDLTGGSIGMGIPVATGAAIACPGRKTICLQGDGGAMYTIQALWTQAREKLDVINIIFANRSYAILNIELMRVGAENAGPKALSMFDLTNPDINFTHIAEGMGVPAWQVDTAEEFNDRLQHCIDTPGPHLIEVVMSRG